jgi:hypothetical protein
MVSLLSVETPLGRSKGREQAFNYLSATPIEFTTTKWMEFGQATSGEFGPDGNLHMGTVTSTIEKKYHECGLYGGIKFHSIHGAHRIMEMLVK